MSRFLVTAMFKDINEGEITMTVRWQAITIIPK